MQQFGPWLRGRRLALGLTLADLAERAGVTRGYLSMIENQRVDNPPSGKVLAKLAGALGMEPAEVEREAQWERTPPAIRARLAQAEDRAQAGQELAQWLRQVSAKRDRGTGKDLDALYRSGQLGRRVNAVLGGNGAANGNGATESHGVDARGARGKAVGLRGAAQTGDASGFTSSVDNSRRVTRGGVNTEVSKKQGANEYTAVGDDGPDHPRTGSVGFALFQGTTAKTRAPKPASVPLINKVAAGYPAGFTDLDYPARVGDELVVVPGYTGLHGGNDLDAFAATVCGASMAPDYAEGDVVVFSPLADVVDGSDCFVRLEPDHETTFKRVFIDEDAGTIRLQPLNPTFAPRTVDREQVAGMFRAVWRMSRL